jgi:hypothetical protein
MGRNKLAFLDVHGAASAPGGDEEIGLAAQKSRDLQHVHRLGGGLGLRRFMDVGEDRISILPEIREDSQTFLESRSAIGGHAAAIGLIERSFEDKRPGDFADLGREKAHVLLAFDHAGTGDQH